MSPAKEKIAVEDPYVKARELLVAEIRTELIGPEQEEGIILSENPVTRYSAGMLFPANFGAKEDAEKSEAPADATETAEGDTDEDSFADDITAALANSFFPSAMGMSFYCRGSSPALKVHVSCATYKKAGSGEVYVRAEISPEIAAMPEFSEGFTYSEGLIRLKKKADVRELKDALKEKVGEENWQSLSKLIRSQREGAWLRKTYNFTVDIDGTSKRLPVIDGALDLVSVCKHAEDSGRTLVTVALENCIETAGRDEENVFFQTSIRIESAGTEQLFEEYGAAQMLTADEEDLTLAMLYRNKKTFAVGHGCAANWELKNGNAKALFTEAVPTYEVLQASFDIEELDGTKTLSMAYLAGLTGEREKITDSLESFCGLYASWIGRLEERQGGVPSGFSRQAARNIERCQETHKRMLAGVEILKTNQDALESFLLANLAMLKQSLYSELQKERRDPGDGEIKWPSEHSEEASKRKWRPFQLAFLLLSIKGTVDPGSEDRKIVDLIWFPTGGGKTEAYLGLSAFTIFYKKLTQAGIACGTTIMMRYTLRLLTAQQFQRACTLICAIESIRRGSPEKFGSEEVSIGLWVGSASTPNTFEDAKRSYDEFISNPIAGCPSPVLSCPWCGTRMLAEPRGGRREYSMRIKSRPARVELFCREPACPFSGAQSKLPIKFVDDDIYENPPTLLFGTVDKFAQMPRKKGVSNIFGLESGSGPELIIQDELHLISGALGTMVALYETAVDFLASRTGKAPKIIASTATVRRAAEQCKNLFARDSRQFPPPGLEIEDSFFSKDDTTKPGRMYLGVMPSGKTQTTASVRLTAKLIQSVYDLPVAENVKDKFWTLVCYFNSIRELGGFISLVNDDIRQYANDLRQRKWRRMRPIYKFEELTSRKQAEEIPKILEQLSVENKGETEGKTERKDRPIDILAATNMISVGVDIDRFGLMLVRGQPKMTSEYIQVSSRIGRRYPGLVVTLYNPARTRDRAHYERFITYHGSFYRNVEPSSITPFSLPARIRALAAVLVTMARHTVDVAGFNEEKGVIRFNPELPELKEIRKFMMDRVRRVDPSEAEEVDADISRIWREWEAFTAGNADSEKDIVYSNQRMGRSLLASSSRNKRPVGWVAPNSMRNVDAECNIDIKDE